MKLCLIVGITVLHYANGFTVPKTSSWPTTATTSITKTRIIPNIINNNGLSNSRLIRMTNEDTKEQQKQQDRKDDTVNKKQDAVLSDVPSSTTIDSMGDLTSKLTDSKSSDASTSFLTSLGGKYAVGTSFFFVVDYILRKIFQAKGIAFPSMMGGCVLIFSSLVALEAVSKGTGDKIFNYLTPSSDALVRWLPVFFVPGMAMLPLSPIDFGNAVDVLKILAMIPLGFFFTLITTAYSVLGVRAVQGKLGDSNKPPKVQQNKIEEAKTVQSKQTKRKMPYSVNKCRNLLLTSGIFGALSILLTKIGSTNSMLYTPIMTTFMICSTLGSFLMGGNLPPKVTSILHPIMTATSYTWLVVALFASLTGSSFGSVLQTYRVGSSHLLHAGAGDLLLYMLGPGVCSLSIAMYSRKTLMKQNLAAVLIGMLVSSTGGILSSALYVRFMDLPGAILRLSLITRNVTTALAMALTTILGGNTAIIASLLVTTGVFGSTILRKFMNFIGLYDPVSRGLGVGAAAQGIGVASLKEEKDSLPFAAINMILTALCSRDRKSVV